ncbi:MAG: cytochrome c3 family protein [Myxococcota bacterium]
MPFARQSVDSCWGIWSIWLLLGVFSASDAGAVDWERMVMPGPLVAAHEEEEKSCASCHKAFDTDAQRALCLTCHEDVSADISADIGFHGRNDLARSGQCKSCHSDHLGRDADIHGLSESTFDHRQTDYPLLGRHGLVACQDCHEPELPKREAPSECIDCHRTDDAHDGALSEDCGQCHDELRWSTTRFDHAKTSYPLTGAHREASCEGCHAGERYKETPQTCVSCHSMDDAHQGRFGSDCADCHSTSGWQKKSFDHGSESGFPLRGVHAETECSTCHRAPPGERTLPENCAGCHSSEDVHAGRFGIDCAGCHSETAWSRVQFDHEAASDFALKGAHAESSCNACHTGQVDQTNEKIELSRSCAGCHGDDDVHSGELGTDCAACHSEDSFSSRVRFDHDLTPFPLLGLHAVSSCESCHVADKTFQEADLDCVSCHQQKDVHDQTLGSDCAVCHNPNGWKFWRFDHSASTDFDLNGAHAGVECGVCHKTPMTPRTQISTSCSSCHGSNDPHRGGFGQRCGDCHGEEAWKPAQFGRRKGRAK